MRDQCEPAPAPNQSFWSGGSWSGEGRTGRVRAQLPHPVANIQGDLRCPCKSPHPRSTSPAMGCSTETLSKRRLSFAARWRFFQSAADAPSPCRTSCGSPPCPSISSMSRLRKSVTTSQMGMMVRQGWLMKLSSTMADTSEKLVRQRIQNRPQFASLVEVSRDVTIHRVQNRCRKETRHRHGEVGA